MNIIRVFICYNRKTSNYLLKKFPLFFNGPSYVNELLKRITSDIKKNDPSSIIEVGGIDRPLLNKRHNYQYIGIDIEEKEECYLIYDKFYVQSIESPLNSQGDIIISITLLEHVEDNTSSINNIFSALNPGGQTHHYIPSKNHPYSIALRLVGPTLQKKLIPFIRPDAVDVTGYPAYFDQCSPQEMRENFARAGFTNIEVKSFYRANDYFAFFLPLYLLVTTFENLCSLFNLSFFASGFVISGTSPRNN